VKTLISGYFRIHGGMDKQFWEGAEKSVQSKIAYKLDLQFSKHHSKKDCAIFSQKLPHHYINSVFSG
jgi:hypothetical protein